MSEKKLDVGALVNNGLGHPLARALAEGIWKSQLLRRYASRNPGMMSVISKGAMALTSLIEVGGDHPLARFANYLAETLATENLELLKQYQENPDDPEIAKKFQGKVDAAMTKAEEAKVIVALEHVHKDDQCAMVSQYVKDATPPSFGGGKPGQPPRVNPTAARLYPMTFSAAAAAGKPLCGLCYPALSNSKAEEREKSKEIVPGRNFMEYVLRYKAENPLNPKFKTFWANYLVRLEGPDGPDLARKFQEAFDGRHSYEAFCFVADLPHRNALGGEEWHHALDALLGRVTPPGSLKRKIEGFLNEEKRQTEEMFKALFAWLAKSNAERAAKIACKKGDIAKLDEEWKAGQAARKRSKLVNRLVLIGLAIIAVSYVIITHTS